MQKNVTRPPRKFDVTQVRSVPNEVLRVVVGSGADITVNCGTGMAKNIY